MRILSGIQPSGKLHLGNYLGMMRQCIDLQSRGESFIFLANYHALTTVSDPDKLRADTMDAALDFLACGLDPARTHFFRQSDVPEVHELAWLLSVVTPVGLLERCHSYKDKLAKGMDASHGLFAYPVLMAADILIYQSTTVPVGKDQKQHLEVARDIAIKFNNKYGEVFTVPEAYIPEDVATVPGTDGQKMSKSYNNTIELFAPPKEIKAAIMSIVTDSASLEEPKDPESNNVYKIYKLIAPTEKVEEMAQNFRAGGYGYGHAKKALLEAFTYRFAEFRDRREAFAANPDMVEKILHEGAEKARVEAGKTLTAARKAVGLE